MYITKSGMPFLFPGGAFLTTIYELGQNVLYHREGELTK